MKNLLRSLVTAAFFLPALASAATVVGGVGGGGWFLGIGGGNGAGFGCAVGTICTLANQILFIINFVLIPLLFAVAFIVLLYGIAKAYIFSHGDPEEVKRGHTLVLWGVAGFVIMISFWGIVAVVSNTLLLSGVPAPIPPTSF